MNRVAMTFILLAVTGGCMAVDPDPIDEAPYGSPRRAPAQSQAWQQTNQVGWAGADGKAVQTVSWDRGSVSYSSSTNTTRSSGNSSQNATAANKSSSGDNSASAMNSAKAPSSRPAAKTDKSEDTLVKASYTETKDVTDKNMSKSASAKPSSVETMPKSDEPESPPINLGLLRLINSKRITFHYEVKDTASTAKADLEIWGTTDQRNWKKYEAIKRSPSSLVVDVKDEGLYGFTMIARGKGELTKDQPPVGEPPQIWVAVDRTKPVVQLIGVDMNAEEKTPTLVVRWNAKDRNFGARPITLLYSERPEGPWFPFAATLENNGHYEWVMPPCAPANLCVRAMAIDLMGNVGMAQTTTLHLPGRSTSSAANTEPALVELPRLRDTSLPICETNIRPLAIRAPRPTASILSAVGE